VDGQCNNLVTVVIFPPELISASAVPGKSGNKKIASFSLKWCITAFPGFNQSLLDFFNLVEMQLIFTLL